ncbi:MAG: hypothetical protein IJ386_07010 [Clostridia bacterium]|nr:hypothetical protein [Clostridia bacterium]
MKLFELLNEEYKLHTEGTYAPYYYRSLGYRKDYAAKPAMLRANGVYSLFTEPSPVILKNELIAGNTKLLFTEADELSLEYAKRITDSFKSRWFVTNSDHFAPDYSHILTVGIPGIISEIDASLEKYADDEERCLTLRGMRRTMCGFSRMVANYADAAEKCLGCDGYDDARLHFIINNCRAITERAPKSFGEAFQLVWLCHSAFLMEGRYAMAFGRLDQYLYPFYKADVENGTLTDAEVIEMLENVFIRLQNDVVNIAIGGQSPEGKCRVNGLSRCILKAVGNCNVPGPNLSLRLTEDTPEDFLDDCLKTIGTGLGYPALMNDDVNIAALERYGYSHEDACNYCMVGCIENFITGMQPPWSDGRFDPPKYFDYVFNHGRSETNRSVGLDLGDVESIKSMDEFMEWYKRELAYGAAEYVAIFNNTNDSLNQRYFPEPFLSCFCDDCIGRGLDINNGGAKYPSVHGACAMGIGTVADSLAAIEKVVFVDRTSTLAEIGDALNANFEGYGELREKLLAAPKYGNNDDFVDKYAVWYIDYMHELFSKYRTRDGGYFYILAAANVNNIGAGKVINATPDGRLRGEPLSDAASPTYGRDTKGATSTVNSLVKPDYTKVSGGSVVNQKFSPSMFGDEKRAKLRALIRTYFKKGGQEMQINATSREVLIDAMEHPEKYGSLVVRVSGFSAFYVTLGRDVQTDILNRTQQE